MNSAILLLFSKSNLTSESSFKLFKNMIYTQSSLGSAGDWFQTSGGYQNPHMFNSHSQSSVSEGSTSKDTTKHTLQTYQYMY